jgi:hypothetical protein
MGTHKLRRTATLAESLDKRLNLYTLAARANCRLTYAAAVSAAGASVMCLVPVADAKIIYTPAHVQIRQSSSFLLDFDAGPKREFILARTIDCGTSSCAAAVHVENYFTSDEIAATSRFGDAVALRLGERMGPRRLVTTGARMALVEYAGPSHGTVWFGQWGNGGKGLKNGYLGLKFMLYGKVHYGWARVSVTVKNNKFNTVTLTGFAFETIPNKSIVVGKTHGPDVIVKPATLGGLAAGANARSTAPEIR